MRDPSSAKQASNSPPKVLYKYCDTRGIDILRSRRLKVTPFKEFNDPFEVTPRMRPDFLIEDARAAVTEPEFVRGLYERAVLDGPFKDYQLFCDLVEASKDDLAAKCVADYAHDAAEFRETHRDTVSNGFGLICLSAVYNDILMWAHYTRGHSGFVLGFDTSNSFFAHGPPLHEVNYAIERVLMGHYKDHRDDHRDVIKHLIRRKSPHWEYECEWRQLRTLAECQNIPDPGRAGKQLFYAALPSAAVCEVIVGCRCDDTDLREVLNQREFAHVKTRRATMHEANFELVFHDAPFG